MASIVSLYSAAVSAHVPTDLLPPAPPVIGTVTAIQNTSTGAVPQGRTLVTLNWTIPTENVPIGGEYVGNSTGGADVFDLLYTPVTPASYSVYEVTAYAGLDTTLSADVHINEDSLTLASATGLEADDWVELIDGDLREYNQVDSVDGLIISLKNQIRSGTFTAATSTVKEVTVSLKTAPTDYAMDLDNGQITMVDGHATEDNPIFVAYTAVLQDLDHFELYRIPGDLPLTPPVTQAVVVGVPGCVTVDDAISPSLNTLDEQLAATDNGKTWTYYLFAADDEALVNYSMGAGVMVETIPTIPQGFHKHVGDSRIVLNWDAILDDNVDGVNVYRTDGSVFDPTNARKVNSAPVEDTQFDDSVLNETNRVAEGAVPFPINGGLYTYKIEAQDTVSEWDTGTRNQSAGQSAVTMASKTA